MDWIDLGVLHARELVKHNGERLLFHNLSHMNTTMQRAERIGRVLGLSSHQLRLTILAAACHDMVWLSLIHFLPGGEILRQSQPGNEKFSVILLHRWMQEYAGAASESDKMILEEAIMATVTCWSPEEKTIIQPNVTANSHPVALCVALADLGSAGIDGKEFIKESNLRFREINIDMEAYFAVQKDRLSSDKKAQFQQRILNWSLNQIHFAIGRKKRFETDLGNLTSLQKSAVRQIFSKFDEAVQAATKTHQQREQGDFWFTVSEMGYPIF